MTDPGVVAAIGLETVEWLDEAGDRVTVRVSGRWRRRPTATGQPWLVVEARGERHRFPAMPEPPGLGGTLPGTWRMSFRVPADVARAPSVRAWLQLGAVLVPLPAEPPVESIAPMLEPHAVGVHELEEAAREEQHAARVAALGHDLEQREADVARLEAAVAEREQALRRVRQQAHAAESVRLELTRERGELEDLLAEARQQVRGLEDDLVGLQRRVDEAEHLLAIARHARPPAPAVAVAPAPLAPALPRAHRRIYAAERSLARIARRVPTPVVLERLPGRPEWSGVERDFVLARARGGGPIAMRERAGRAAAEALSEGLRHRLEEHEARSERAFATLDELRGEIEWVRAAAAALREDAPTERAAAPAVTPPAAGGNGGLDLHRLEAARTRLQEQTPARPDEEPPPPAAESDPRATFSLAPIADQDPGRAGALLIELLPAQGLVHPEALAYDLIVGSVSTVRVTVAGGGHTTVERSTAPRARDDVRFQLVGDPEAIIRRLTAGPLRRLLRRRLARIRGDRTGLAALQALLTARLDAGELEHAGVRLAALDLEPSRANRATSG